MPNFKLPTRVREEITQNVKSLMDRRFKYALLNPPITHDHVQRSAATPHLLALMHNVLEQGAIAGAQDREPDVAVLRRDFPELQRDVMLRLRLPKPVLLKQESYVYLNEREGGGTRQVYGAHDHFVALNPEVLTAEERQQVVEWVHNVVKVRRYQTLVQRTVKNVMPYIESTGHILARWPLLASLIDDPRYKTNLNLPPTHLHRYQFEPGQLSDELLQMMRAAEPLILQAQLLPEPEVPKDQVVAILRCYEKLPTDRF